MSKRAWESSASIVVEQANPKKPGSASYTRYEAYKRAKTVGELLSLGGSTADLRNDVDKAFIQVLDGDSDSSSDESESESESNRSLGKGSRIFFLQANPKKRGSASYDRYEAYKRAKTVTQMYHLGGTTSDLKHDLAKGFIRYSRRGEDDDPNADDDDEEEEEPPEEDEDEEPQEEEEAPQEEPQEEEEEDEEELEEEGDLLKEGEVRHMLLFFMCQLRWQCGMIVEPRRCDATYRVYRTEAFDPRSFDDELKRSKLETEDLAACAGMMLKFLSGPAKGDRWVPWHCAVCEQELFLMEEVRSRNELSEEQRFAAGAAFSASRWVPLWREAILPNLLRNDVDVAKRPEEAFQRGSRVHRAMVSWRKQGHKLHTPSFNCYPPRGASGDKFTDYIAQRHADFASLGVRAFALLSAADNNKDDTTKEKAPPTMADLDRVFRAQPRVGPTMSKVFLVTTHLWYPQLGILDDACEVGDGANSAFEFLFKKGKKTSCRKKKLQHLFDYLAANVDRLEPRFNPMLAFVAEHTRKAFPCIPAASLADNLTIYDLQVCLCEWRKFRKNVDHRRSILNHQQRRGLASKAEGNAEAAEAAPRPAAENSLLK